MNQSLTDSSLRLTPTPLIPGIPTSSSPVPSQQHALPLPALPATFALSPTSNYPAPFGSALLGERLTASVRLANISDADVRGVKMMLEVQSPAARTRLGEVVHGGPRPDDAEPASADARPWDELPCLAAGESLEIDVEHPITELGQHILICSVAWETTEGRRTFQRFLKFNANAPLAIKTRVHTPFNPDTSLDAAHRGDIYLEVLMQNVSPQAMVFGTVTLQPVEGMTARSVASLPGVTTDGETQPEGDSEVDGPSLLPGDTTQRLFIVSPEPDADDDSPTPLSSFPPSYAAGTILPLGRLDITWVAGPHREPGHFLTSTLNRRTPVAPISGSRPASILGAPRKAWEFDLVIDGERVVPEEEEFDLSVRLAVRSPPVLDAVGASNPPAPLQLGVQLLTPAPVVPQSPPPPIPAPSVAVQAPSRTGTPQRPSSPSPSLRSISNAISRAPSISRTFSPGPSRPMTPVSAQLRHAAVSNIASPSTPAPPAPPPAPPAAVFPPAPVLERPQQPLAKRLAGATAGAPPSAPTGRVAPLGASLVLPPPAEWKLVRERDGTSYAAEVPGTTAHRRWEAQYQLPLQFIAMKEGLAELGGLRVLLIDDEGVGREWESLGSVWVEAS